MARWRVTCTVELDAWVDVTADTEEEAMAEADEIGPSLWETGDVIEGVTESAERLEG